MEQIRQNSLRSVFSNAVIPIIAMNIIMFILQMVIPGLTESLLLKGGDVFVRPWILLTHMFLHNDPNHLIWNMFALVMFGPILEAKIGTRRFLLIYFSTGIVAGFIASFFYASALGASAAIMGMLGCLIILMPDLPILFFFVIQMPLWIAGIVWACMDIFYALMPSSGIGSVAHLSGMGLGLLYGLFLKNRKKEFHKRFRHKEHIDEEDLKEFISKGRI